MAVYIKGQVRLNASKTYAIQTVNETEYTRPRYNDDPDDEINVIRNYLFRVRTVEPLTGYKVDLVDDNYGLRFDPTGRWLIANYLNNKVAVYELGGRVKMIMHRTGTVLNVVGTILTTVVSWYNNTPHVVEESNLHNSSVVRRELWGVRKPWFSDLGHDWMMNWLLFENGNGMFQVEDFGIPLDRNVREHNTNTARFVRSLTDCPLGFDVIKNLAESYLKPWSPKNHRYKVVKGSAADKTVVCIMWIMGRTPIYLPPELWFLIIDFMVAGAWC